MFFIVASELINMDVVILKRSFNDKYGNNATWIAFSIQDIVIHAIIEVSNWEILLNCFLSGNHPYHLPPF